MSNVNMDIIRPFIKKACATVHIEPEIKFSGFNNYFQDSMLQNSPLYSFAPDYILLFLDGDELLGASKKKLFFGGTKITQTSAAEHIENLQELLSHIKSRSGATILLNTIVLTPNNSFTFLDHNCPDKSFSLFESLYNSKLSDLSDNKTYVVDFRNLCQYFGYRMIFDQRLWYAGRIKLSHKGLAELAKLYINYLKAIEGKVKKCLVLDLDNTLWGGIIGEDGPGGIRLGLEGIGLAFVEFQEELLNLKNQGVLLAINSKNNFDEVKEVFEKHPAMVLKLDDFASVKVNWNDKSDNVKEIAEELNIGLDSFVFLDDSDFERALVKRELPQLEVPAFPKDPAYLREWLIEIYNEFFPKVKLSREDMERTEMYRAQVQREQTKKSAHNIADFLESLDMKTVLYINSKVLVPRISQLTQRTNQFNLTTKRYSEADILLFMARGGYIFALDISDRFGPNGVVGLLMVNPEEKFLAIDNFLLSCRVIGRDIEKFLIGSAINWLRRLDMNQDTLCGFYVPTSKNKIVGDIYDKVGFRKVDENKWVWNISDKYDTPEFIKITGVIIDDRKSEESPG